MEALPLRKNYAGIGYDVWDASKDANFIGAIQPYASWTLNNDTSAARWQSPPVVYPDIYS